MQTRWNLTLTRVVFEFWNFISFIFPMINLTLTRVVFEYMAEKSATMNLLYLTLTRVVFELGINNPYPPLFII